MSRTKLMQLPPAREAELPAIRDEWLGVGLRAEPADRRAAEAGVRLAYQAAGLEPPKITIWLDSPYRGAIGAALLAQVWDQVWDQVGAQVWDQVRDQVWAQVWAQVRAQVRDQVRDQVWDQVWDQVGAQVRDQVRDQVWAQVWAQVGAQVGAQVRDQVRDQVGAQVWDQVWDQVGDQVWDQVGAQVWDQVGAQVWDQVGAQVRDQVWDQVGAQVYRCACGQHDASWLGFYCAFKGLITDVDRLDGVMQTARAAGWWWPFQHAVILTERPISIARDGANRLHCEDGPALLYPDGFGIWAWHGLRVDRKIIEQPETITATQIFAERNAEVRRVLTERFGPARLIAESGAECIHRDDWGALYRLEQPGDEPLVMVKVVNATREPDGTFKEYTLRVPPTIQTAREAVAWTFDVESSQYRPLVQT